MKLKQALTFDDVLLVPQYSEIESRGNVDTSVDLGKGIKLSIPIISANMKSVTGTDMCKELSQLGGLPIMHRFYENEVIQLETFKEVRDFGHVGVSVGVKNNDLVDAFVGIGAKIICLDIAHADCKLAFEACEYIAEKYPQILLIAGNVATYNGAAGLYLHGADVVKVGIGSGSICTTRLQAGHGVPQLTALMETSKAKQGYSRELSLSSNQDLKIISDGGHRNSGDLVKALCFADAVMLGSMLAGTDESPGELIDYNGLKYKQHVGSSTYRTNNVEGVSGLVPFKGPLKKVIQAYVEGIQSGCSYHGCTSLTELQADPEFIQITNAGLVESKPHDLLMVK